MSVIVVPPGAAPCRCAHMAQAFGETVECAPCALVRQYREWIARGLVRAPGGMPGWLGSDSKVPLAFTADRQLWAPEWAMLIYETNFDSAWTRAILNMAAEDEEFRAAALTILSTPNDGTGLSNNDKLVNYARAHGVTAKLD